MIDPRTIFAAFIGLLVAGVIVYSTGCDGYVAGLRIGPSACGLKVAGR